MDIKDTMRKELAIILQIDNKADYNNKKFVRSVRNYIEEKNINGSAYGQRFEKQIKSIDENDNFTTENMSCVVCNKESSPKLICQACRDKLIGTSVRKQEEINKSQSSVNASETVSGIINEETKQTIKNTANVVSSGTKKL